MVKKKNSKKQAKPLFLVIGIVLAVFAYPVYRIINAITRVACPAHGYNACDLSVSLGFYYLSLLISIVMSILALVFIIYGTINLVKYKKK